ncbi:glycoside hydrolase domain-containing protein [Terrabacter aerolatus]|uniref:glycoside hydrolase domain-containing protein n=1 Tax=Terrabacter aerolatus TaxID=422442 RepID=UPI001C99E12E|nr:glycoside hydrolase domain-containing protein [Terrabacter aerolatus]
MTAAALLTTSATGMASAGTSAGTGAGSDHRAVPPQHRSVLPLTQYVNPFIGTSAATTSGYAGNNNPGAKVPFGFTDFGPDMPRTNFNGSGGYLNPPDATTGKINFFSLTHLNGVGCPGQGAVGMMPASTPTAVASSSSGVPTGVPFHTATESATPGYYGVTLDNRVKVDLTATTRTGMARFTYPDAGSGYFSIDTRLNGNSNRSTEAGKLTPDHVSLDVSKDGRVLSGQTVAPAFCTPYGTPWNSPVYFYAEFDRPLVKSTEGAVNSPKDGAALLHYSLPAHDPTLTMRVGISAVSVANAKLNLHTENRSSGFEQTRKAADSAWNTRLNTIQVDRAADASRLTPTERARLVKFYTALYRVFGSPTVYSDVNGDFRSMGAERPYPTGVDTTGGIAPRRTANVADYSYVKPGGGKGGYTTHYSSFSLWDTYRSQAHLLALLAPKESSEMMQSLVVDAEQCGAFPHWVDASDDSTPMAGDNALPVLAGAYAFGAKDFDVTSAARLVKQSVFDPTSACNGNKSMTASEQYLRDGYYPSPEWSSSNIERYNSDRAAAAFLAAVPDSVRRDPKVAVTQSDLATLYDRAGWWRHIFDAANGTIATRAAPTTPGMPGALMPGTFHESTEPNYFWSFGYAWTDLIKAIGGKDQAVARLDRLFSIDSSLSTVPTAAQLNGGQDAETFYMGNEMGFNAPWAYNWAGAPASTQYIVQKLMDITFNAGRDGLPGNDDMGALSSWNVFAALGMYPTVASAPGLALSTPQFPAATVWLKNKPLRITTDGDASARPFIAGLTVGRTSHQSSWLPLCEVKGGGAMSFTLAARPTGWATAESLTPPSGPDADYTRSTAAGRPVDLPGRPGGR